MAPSARRGVLCGAPRPPPPRQEDAQTGRGGRGARGGRPGVPTSASGHRAGRGRGACRRSPFVRRGAGPGGGQGALSSPGGGQAVPVGWGVVLSAFVPLPGLPALTLRSYCGRSAAGFGRSATDKALRALRPQRRLRRVRVAQACALWPGAAPSRATLHVCYGVAAATRPARAGGGRGKEAQRCWVTGGESRSPPAAEALQASNSGPARAAPSWCHRGTWKVPREGCFGTPHRALSGRKAESGTKGGPKEEPGPLGR